MPKNLIFSALILYSYHLILAASSSELFWNETQIHYENCSTYVPAGADAMQPSLLSYNMSDSYLVVELNISTGARCLDGTPYKFYYHQGNTNSSDKNKWMIYFQGASFCGSEGYEVLHSCYERTLTFAGTSNATYWGEAGSTYTYTGASGWSSSMEEYNPLFADYNKILMTSCDGTNFLGSLEEPLYYNGTALYFRGMNNTLSAFAYFDNLTDAEEIVIGGASSGGTSALIWSLYLQDFFPKSAKVWTLSDAGLFVDAYSENNTCYLYRFFMQQLASVLRMGSQPTKEVLKNCKYSNANETIWKCLIPEYFFEEINIPVFIINSQNDYKQVTFVGGVGCIALGGPAYCNETERIKIEKVREKFLYVAMQMKTRKPNWGFWLRTCFEHTYHYTWAWYGHEMDVFSAELQRAGNARDAVYEWYFNMRAETSGRAPSYIDLVDWLHNPLCKYGDNQYDEAEETTTPNGYIISNVFYNSNY